MRQPIPDPPNGVRFCRKCNSFLPLSDFPTGRRRYECKVSDDAADPFLSPPHVPQQLLILFFPLHTSQTETRMGTEQQIQKKDAFRPQEEGSLAYLAPCMARLQTSLGQERHRHHPGRDTRSVSEMQPGARCCKIQSRPKESQITTHN